MGIQGLLPVLKSIHEHRKISEFSGQTLAVDAYGWLHRGAYGCAPDLVKGNPTTRYVDYAMHRVRLLKHHNITPYIVFDGGPLPAKKGTESSRLKSREENRERGLALSAQGKHSEARECFVKAVDVTPEMAYQLIKALQSEGVSYVVAPYEADAQMAFLEQSGIVDGIITEDSDLLVFGCKHVLFKLDSDGNCVYIRRENFSRVRELPLHGWSDRQFREMAMLSGCDYLPSIPGLGLKTSHKLLRKHKTVEGVLNAIIRTNSNLRNKIPTDYLTSFRTAELAFLYQRVYDPNTQRLVNLTPVPEGIVGWNDIYVGVEMESEVAKGIAEGSIHPFTFTSMPDINPNFKPLQRSVLSFTRPKAPRSPRKMDTVGSSKQKNTIMNYFASGTTSKKTSGESGSIEELSTHPAKENIILQKILSGTSSGRRTLTSEHDLSRREFNSKIVGTKSKFFNTSNAPENLPPPTPSPPAEELTLTDEDEDEGDNDLVTQELGYISPNSSFVGEIVDVSSPPCSRDGSLEPEELGFSDDDKEGEEDEEEDIPSPQLIRQLRINSQPQFSSLAFGATADVFPTPTTPAPVNDVQPSRDDSDDVFGTNVSIAQRLTLFPVPNISRTHVSSRHDTEEDEVSDDTRDAGSNIPLPEHERSVQAQKTECDLQAFKYDPRAVSSQLQPDPFSSQPLSTIPSTSQATTSSSCEDINTDTDKPQLASWGPDLADFFTQSQGLSEKETGSEGQDDDDVGIVTPRANRRRTSNNHAGDDNEEEDLILSPERMRIRKYPREDDEDVDDDVDLEVESAISVEERTDEDRKMSVEGMWREKWSNPLPSLLRQAKRKTAALSPRSEPKSKRPSLSQRTAGSDSSQESIDRPNSPSPGERHTPPSSSAKPRARPRLSLPTLPTSRAPFPSSYVSTPTTTPGTRKSIPRSNAMSFPAPTRPTTMERKGSTSRKSSATDKQFVDLDSYRYKPLRLR